MRKFFIFLIFLLFLTTAFALTLPPNVQKIAEYNMSLTIKVTFLIAFIIGFLSFTSPCGFVLLPAYLSCAFKERKKAFWMSLVFSLGLIIAFAFVGLIAGWVGDYFNIYKTALSVVSGIVLVFFAYLVLNNKGFGGISFKQDVGQKKTFWSVFLLGIMFAIGWTPCIGPVLSGIILMAANMGSLLKSILLLATYGFGAALPLIILSYFSDTFDWARNWRSKPVKVFGKKYLKYNLISAVILFLVGVIMIYGQGTQFFQRNIPLWTGWNMDFWMGLGDELMKSNWTEAWGNWVGVGVVLILLVFVGYLYRDRT